MYVYMDTVMENEAASWLKKLQLLNKAHNSDLTLALCGYTAGG